MDLKEIRREVAIEAEGDMPKADLTEVMRLMAELYRTWMPSDEVMELLASESDVAQTSERGRLSGLMETLQAEAAPIGALFQRAREREGLTPADLELSFGISAKEIAWWEEGRGMVALLDHAPSVIRQLTTRLGLDPSAFALSFSTQLARQSVRARRYMTERTHMPAGKRLPVADWLQQYLSAGEAGSGPDSAHSP